MKLIARCRRCPITMVRPLGSKIVLPLMQWLYCYNICFTCARREHRWNSIHRLFSPYWFRIKRWYRQLLCSHQWLWIGSASGGTFMHFRKYGHPIGIPRFDPDRFTDWYYCDKCTKSKKTIVSVDETRKIRKELREEELIGNHS